MEKLYERLNEKIKKYCALQASLTLFDYDMDTLAPSKAYVYSDEVMAILSKESYDCLHNKEVDEILDKLDETCLNPIQKANVKELKRILDETKGISKEQYLEYHQLLNESRRAFVKARKENDYRLFAPCLEKIIDYKKMFVKAQETNELKGYDVLLNQYEPGMNQKDLDIFFDLIKEKLVPVVKCKYRKQNDEFLTGYFDKQKQIELSTFLASYIGFDFEKGVMGESIHPYTTEIHNHDVRFTNDYDLHHLTNAMFSALHEGGHGIYEQNIADDLTLTLVGHGASMMMHESQSRFYENCLDHSLEFWKPIFYKVQEYFPQLKEIDVETFVRGCGNVEPSLIRVDADEVTYPIHILIRYEIEKEMIEKDLEVFEIKEKWNKLYQDYLGIEVDCDNHGILQDMHWSGGMVGYFPTYALGSAIASQIYMYLKKINHLDEQLESGNVQEITKYLNDKIHQYGMTKTSKELLKNAIGEELDANVYVDYLINKVKMQYNLD